MTQNYCSPSRYEHGEKNGTCLKRDELLKIARTKNIKISHVKSTKEIASKIKKELEPECNNKETCWLRYMNSNKQGEILRKAYRPEKPKSWLTEPRKWLNTYDILNVMRQYEDRHISYKFFGVYPVDFTDKDSSGYCVGDSLCDFHIRMLLSAKKNKFAMVINLDKHTQGGSHWVALYCNLNTRSKINFGIYYYDSIGKRPDVYNKEKYVTNFMNRIKEQVREVFGEKAYKRFEIRHNTIQKQRKNTECGNFSQVFITQMLKNIQFDTICEKMPGDDEVQKVRDILYRPQNSI